MEIIKQRRSIRIFSKEKILDQSLEEIIEAGTLAPSAKNRQPWFFLVSRCDQHRQDMINKMRYAIQRALKREPDRQDLHMALETVDIMNSSPIIIFVCYRQGLTDTHDDGVNWPLSATDLEVVDVLSIGAAVENMLLKIQELGLGGLWCGDVLYAYPELMEELGIEYPMVSAICIGHPLEFPPARPRMLVSQSYIYI